MCIRHLLGAAGRDEPRKAEQPDTRVGMDGILLNRLFC